MAEQNKTTTATTYFATGSQIMPSMSIRVPMPAGAAQPAPSTPPTPEQQSTSNSKQG